MPDLSLIRCHAVEVAYAPDSPLMMLDFSLPAGAPIVVLGDHVARLKVVMQSMAGVRSICSGVIEYPTLGLSYSADSIPNGLYRQMSFVDREVPLLSILKGLDNVLLPARYHKIADELAIKKHLDDLLGELSEQFDWSLLPAYMGELQKRILLIARSLILGQAAVLVDDPLSGLPPVEQRVIIDWAARLGAEHDITLILSSDNLLSIANHAERILLQTECHIQYFPTWQQLITCEHPEVVEYLSQQRSRYARVTPLLNDEK